MRQARRRRRPRYRDRRWRTQRRRGATRNPRSDGPIAGSLGRDADPRRTRVALGALVLALRRELQDVRQRDVLAVLVPPTLLASVAGVKRNSLTLLHRKVDVDDFLRTAVRTNQRVSHRVPLCPAPGRGPFARPFARLSLPGHSGAIPR